MTGCSHGKKPTTPKTLPTLFSSASMGELSVRFPLAGVEVRLDQEFDLIEEAPPG
ncbi:hypothetical protein GCM10010245_57840 [Streptomyces spectabilis]|nr:hypothetical protein GCM10010245_57840 [Streptomyces spectabilis]